MIHYLIKTDNLPTTILIRLMVGAVFLSEGIQKFLYAFHRGVGRFEGMGFPAPMASGAWPTKCAPIGQCGLEVSF